MFGLPCNVRRLTGALWIFSATVAATQAAEMKGNLWTQIVSVTGSTLTPANGPAAKQLYQRYGVSLDDNHRFAAFYSDVISTTTVDGVLRWETYGEYTFAAEDKVFYHTTGSVKLATGEWMWDLREVTGGTGRFANITATPKTNMAGDFGGTGGGCFNPPNDPQGFPNIVICQNVMDWTY